MSAPASRLAIPHSIREILEAAYSKPPRAYHHLGHVDEVLERFEEVARDVGWTKPREVHFALLFHDAIYVAGSITNELESAALARKTLANEGVELGRIAELIELTAKHGKLTPSAVDLEAALFLDCDMAILGAEPDRFDAYDRAIAAEYAHVPPEFFEAGRRTFLERLLAAEHIFLSPYFEARLDVLARSNLRRRLLRSR